MLIEHSFSSDEEYIKNAYEKYRSRYPDDEVVTLDDFRRFLYLIRNNEKQSNNHIPGLNY